MGVREVTGLCLAVHDYEDDYLEMVDGGDGIGISGLVQAAARRLSPPGSVLHSFSHSDGIPHPIGDELEDEADADDAEDVKIYRRKSRHEYPPIYQVSIRVEAKALGKVETAAYWQGRVAAFWEAVAREREAAARDAVSDE